METSKFDIADYLDSKEMIAEFLNTILEEGDSTDVIDAIGHIALAHFHHTQTGDDLNDHLVRY